MAEIVVRDVDDAVVEKLRERAEAAGRSLEAEVKVILAREANSGKVDMETAHRLAGEFRARFKGRKLPDSAELIREDRDSR